MKTGRLVERVAPSLVKQRAAQVAARKDKREAKRRRQGLRESARCTFDGVDMRAEFRRLVALPVFTPIRRELAALQLSIHRSRQQHSSGHHKVDNGAIHVTIGTGNWYQGSAVILHELCHAAHRLLGLTRRRRQRFRLPTGQSGTGMRHACHDAEFHDLLRIAACQAYGLDGARLMRLHRDEGGSRRAYSMDRALLRALAERYASSDSGPSADPRTALRTSEKTPIPPRTFSGPGATDRLPVLRRRGIVSTVV
jgi:hypothetical protein